MANENMDKPWWKSLTVWGSVVYAVATVVAPHIPGADAVVAGAAGAAHAYTAGDVLGAVMQGVGAVMAAKGLRTAVAVNGAGK